MVGKNQFLKLAVAAALGMSAAAAQADAIYTATDATYGVFDASSGSRALTLNANGALDIKNVSINIVFSKCDDPSL